MWDNGFHGGKTATHKRRREMNQIHVDIEIEVARAIAAAIITRDGMDANEAKAIIALKRHLRRAVREHDAKQAAIVDTRMREILAGPRSSLDQFI
jgi:hypothetical protein